MKTVLFVNGCVRGTHSRTLEMARRYMDTLCKEGEIQIVERNLSEEPITFLTEQSFQPETGEVCAQRDTHFAEEFSAADQIVIAAPFWEFMCPAVVSCYMEAVSVAGITFRYSEKGSEGLCRAERMTYIYTSGDVLPKEDTINEQYFRRLARLYGIPVFDVISAQGLDIDPARAQSIVEEACRAF